MLLDLGIDAFGLLRLLAEATSHHGVKKPLRRELKEPRTESELNEQKPDAAASCSHRRSGPSVVVKRLSAVKYATVHSKDCVIIGLTGNAVAEKKINLYAPYHENNPSY